MGGFNRGLSPIVLLATGSRLFSAYVIQDIKFWVITDAEDDDGQRLATTVLLPEDY